MICWHKWERWKVTKEGSVQETGDRLTGTMLPPEQRYTIGSFIEQRRECGKCGLLQVRRDRV